MRCSTRAAGTGPEVPAAGPRHISRLGPGPLTDRKGLLVVASSGIAGVLIHQEVDERRNARRRVARKEARRSGLQSRSAAFRSRPPPRRRARGRRRSARAIARPWPTHRASRPRPPGPVTPGGGRERLARPAGPPWPVPRVKPSRLRASAWVRGPPFCRRTGRAASISRSASEASPRSRMTSARYWWLLASRRALSLVRASAKARPWSSRALAEFPDARQAVPRLLRLTISPGALPNLTLTARDFSKQAKARCGLPVAL